jgi:predicted aspartyl protease
MPQLDLSISDPGPMLDAMLWVSAPRRRVLEAQGLTVPKPVFFRALVDTGASCTCVDPSIIQQLKLTPTGATGVHTPSTAGNSVTCNMYDVQVIVPGLNGKLLCNVESLAVVEASLKAQNLDALIGRDILALATLIYNGPADAFTLCF